MIQNSILKSIRSRFSLVLMPLQLTAMQRASSETCTCSYSMTTLQRSTTSSSRLPTLSTNGPATLKYPFPIQYLKDREMIVHDMARRPLAVEQLPGSLFNVPVRIDILHRVVRYLRAKWQQGTHKAKVCSPIVQPTAWYFSHTGIHHGAHSTSLIPWRGFPGMEIILYWYSLILCCIGIQNSNMLFNHTHL